MIGYCVVTLVALAAALEGPGAFAGVVWVPVVGVVWESVGAPAAGLAMGASTVSPAGAGATGGLGGLTGIPPARVLGFELISPAAYLALTLVCTLACVLVLLALVRSPFGRALKALRDDETAAIALGKHPVMLRLVATTIGGAMAAIGGSLYAFYVSFVNPESFKLDYSVLLMAMVIIGGGGQKRTPRLAAAYADEYNAAFDRGQGTQEALGRVRAAGGAGGGEEAAVS